MRNLIKLANRRAYFTQAFCFKIRGVYTMQCDVHHLNQQICHFGLHFIDQHFHTLQNFLFSAIKNRLCQRNANSLCVLLQCIVAGNFTCHCSNKSSRTGSSDKSESMTCCTTGIGLWCQWQFVVQTRNETRRIATRLQESYNANKKPQSVAKKMLVLF